MDYQCTVENLHRGREEILQSRRGEVQLKNYAHAVYRIRREPPLSSNTISMQITLTITPSGHCFSKRAVQIDSDKQFVFNEVRVGHYRYHGMRGSVEPEAILRDIVQQHVGIARGDYDYSFAVKRPWIEYRELYNEKIVIQRWSHSYLDDDCMAHINSTPVHPSIAARIIEPNVFDKMIDAFYCLLNRFGIF